MLYWQPLIYLLQVFGLFVRPVGFQFLENKDTLHF